MIVPELSIVCMVISAILSIGLPVGLYIYLRKRYKLKALPLLVGASAFILFALILEQLMHSLVLGRYEDGAAGMIASNPALYVIYGIFAAGIFEGTARFISLKFLKTKYVGIGTGLSYGIGHGGVEAVLLAGVTMIGNIVVSIAMNSGVEFDFSLFAVLIDTEPVLFLVSGIERVFAVVIQISLSLIVWYSVTKKGKTWLFPAAIILHAAIDLPAALYQAGAIGNIALTEVIVGASALVMAVLTVFLCKSFKKVEDV